MHKRNSRIIAVVSASIGFLGLGLAIPGYFHSWESYKRCQKWYFGTENCDYITQTQSEPAPPTTYIFISDSYRKGDATNKSIGAFLAVVAFGIAVPFSKIARDFMEEVETIEAMDKLADIQAHQQELSINTQTEKRMLLLEYADKVKEFSRLFDAPDAITDDYFQKEFAINGDKEPEAITSEKQPAQEEAPKSDELTVDEYLGLLIQKGIKEGEIRELQAKSWNNKKPSSEQHRALIDELVKQGIAEWLNETKTKFRLNIEEG